MNQDLRVAVVGASGRMGGEVVRAVTAAGDMSVVATVDVDDDLGAITAANATVMVDFTHPDAVMEHIRFAVDAGVHCVVGTSGFDALRLAQVQEISRSNPAVGVLVAPNFALGAVLAMKFAAMAAKYFESAEVVELHHAGKVDAPSGTAVAAARGIAAARAQAGLGAMPDATTLDPDGARGAVLDGVHLHAVRLPGLVAHLEVLLGSPGDVLTIRHDSMSRESFMPGVLTAVRAIADHPGLTVGLESLLDG